MDLSVLIVLDLLLDGRDRVGELAGLRIEAAHHQRDVERHVVEVGEVGKAVLFRQCVEIGLHLGVGLVAGRRLVLLSVLGDVFCAVMNLSIILSVSLTCLKSPWPPACPCAPRLKRAHSADRRDQHDHLQATPHRSHLHLSFSVGHGLEHRLISELMSGTPIRCQDARNARTPLSVAEVTALIDANFPQIHAGGRSMFIEAVEFAAGSCPPQVHRALDHGPAARSPVPPCSRSPISASMSP